LRVIAKFRPTAFVMENVKGLLSSKVKSSLIFEQIRRDLANPVDAIANGASSDSLNGAAEPARNRVCQYNIFSFVGSSLIPDGDDFVIRTEN
jgi:DNA (cytosine-5)-methyltransferase 1